MKSVIAILGLGIIAGCTTHEPPKPQPGSPVTPLSAPAVPGSSAALLFDPPLTQYAPPVNLDRTGRGEAAFAGFEQTSTSTYDVWTYNNASAGGYDFYNRSANVDHSGTLTR